MYHTHHPTHRPDVTVMVDWALNNNYLYISIIMYHTHHPTHRTDVTVMVDWAFKTNY